MKQEINKRFEKVESRIEKLEGFFNNGISKKGILVKCKCGYSWITKSNAILTSCPKCGAKVRIEELIECFKCGKKLSKSKAIFGFNHYFHSRCYKKFKEDADKKSLEAIKKIA